MYALDETIKALRDLAKLELETKVQRLEILNSSLPAAFRDEQEGELAAGIASIQARFRRLVLELTTFPPHHLRHQMQMEEFHSVASFGRSVFIMTKFPNRTALAARDAELAQVIDCVRDAVTDCGYTPRVAFDKQYHVGLWDNVELYLLGCGRGVAIVEDKYLPELNPNVSMEWGWMRGMGRPVLYLIEQEFNLERADWGGLLKEPFAWDAPSATVREAVRKWLPPLS